MIHPILILLLLTCVLAEKKQDYCYSQDTNPYRYYSETTTYDTARSHALAEEEIIPGCEAVGLWTLVRHGTRYSGVDIVAEMKRWLPELRDDINQAHQEGRGTLCAEDLSGINTWDSPMPDDSNDELAEAGWDENRGLTRRHKVRFPDLLDRPYDKDQFVFEHSQVEGDRTRDTARALAEGLFGTYEGMEFIPVPQPDTLLQFSLTCQRYLDEVGNMPVEEYEKFIEGPYIQAVLRNLANKAGLSEDYFSYDRAYLLFHNCRLEYGLYDTAPWCALFSQADLQAFEYADTIRFYYEVSYPYDINWEMSCNLMVDLMNFFNEHIAERNAPVFRSLSGHGRTTISFYTSLGLYQPEEHLRADNFEEQIQGGKFNISTEQSQATSIALTLYKCESGEHRIKTFTMDRLVEIPGCSLDEYNSCSFTDFAALFQDRADECDFDELCTVNEPSVRTNKAWMIQSDMYVLIFLLISSLCYV